MSNKARDDFWGNVAFGQSFWLFFVPSMFYQQINLDKCVNTFILKAFKNTQWDKKLTTKFLFTPTFNLSCFFSQGSEITREQIICWTLTEAWTVFNKKVTYGVHGVHGVSAVTVFQFSSHQSFSHLLPGSQLSNKVFLCILCL